VGPTLSGHVKRLNNAKKERGMAGMEHLRTMVRSCQYYNERQPGTRRRVKKKFQGPTSSVIDCHHQSRSARRRSGGSLCMIDLITRQRIPFHAVDLFPHFAGASTRVVAMEYRALSLVITRTPAGDGLSVAGGKRWFVLRASKTNKARQEERMNHLVEREHD
jgi:hypothetical protein